MSTNRRAILRMTSGLAASRVASSFTAPSSIPLSFTFMLPCIPGHAA